MPAGFFSQSTLLQEERTEALVARCSACGLYRGCKSPKMPPTGQGKRKVLIVAEAPGADEDDQGKQLVGKAGQALRRVLAGLGVDLDRDCVKTNAIICRPPDNRTPDPQELDYCRPNLTKAIQTYDPDVIIPMGHPALSTVLAGKWRDEVGPMTRWAGWRIPSRKPNVWICPTWHPSYMVRNDYDKPLWLWWGRHLRAAFCLSGKPWNIVPDYTKDVELIWDTREAAVAIRSLVKRGIPLAFDYETNRLKSDHPQAAIHSCSIAWDNMHEQGMYGDIQCIAFPWAGEAVQAMDAMTKSPSPKIASNMKFEDRWTRRVFGHRVRNWRWDTLLGAHTLDTRKSISSIKFQSFVRLGQPSYNHHISPMLEADDARSANRIKQIDPRDLLLYNGLDSVVEYRVARIQMVQMGVVL